MALSTAIAALAFFALILVLVTACAYAELSRDVRAQKREHARFLEVQARARRNTQPWR